MEQVKNQIISHFRRGLGVNRNCVACKGNGYVLIGEKPYFEIMVRCKKCNGTGYIADIAHLEEHTPCKGNVEGSSPSVGSKEVL